jgi:hypothetical protein
VEEWERGLKEEVKIKVKPSVHLSKDHSKKVQGRGTMHLHSF